MIEPLLELDPGARERMAHALASGALPLRASRMAFRSCVGVDATDELMSTLIALEEQGLDPRSASVLVRSIDALNSRNRKPDLVWSGPDAPGVYARNTRQVYEELIEGAQRSLWLSSYAYFDGPATFASLALQMEEREALSVKLLLNIQRPRGDTTTAADLVARFAVKFWTTDWPGRIHPEVYYAPSSLEMGGLRSVLHAKVIVADDEKLFVTSANLTEAAFDHNIEAGLLVRDGVLALSMVRHFAGLVESGVLKRLHRG